MHEQYRGERGSGKLLYGQEMAGVPVPRAAAPRFAVIPVLAACLLLVSILVLFFQVQSFLGHVETTVATADAGGETRLRAIGRQVEMLRDKLHGALADSVELRLKALERNIDAGKVGADDVRAFEELLKDLKLLEDYAESGPATALDDSRRDHGRFRPLPGGEGGFGKSNLVQELADLKTLFYFCLAGLGTGTVVMVGYYWVLQRRNYRRIRTVAGQLPVLPRP